MVGVEKEGKKGETLRRGNKSPMIFTSLSQESRLPPKAREKGDSRKKGPLSSTESRGGEGGFSLPASGFALTT